MSVQHILHALTGTAAAPQTGAWWPAQPLQQVGLAARRAACYALLGAVTAFVPLAHAQQQLPPESPYFVVQGAEPGVDTLPLKTTDVHATVRGVVADVTVNQRYRNEGEQPIEARYIFPAGTLAAVHGLTVRVGEREVVAQIREKQAARIEYDTAKREGRTSALLEQHRPNVFAMNVANILPGDQVDVELRYNELLAPKEGRYEFVFPTVVGPRYAGTAAPDDEGQPALADGAAHQPFPAQPVLHQGTPNPAAFNLTVDINSPLPIADLRSSSHAIDTRRNADAGTQAQVTLAPAAARGAWQANNRDFILSWGLAGEQIQSGLLLERGTDENFFLAMVQPPKAVAPAQISPRDYIFVVDTSGSMNGFPLETSKELMRQLFGKLRASDRFNVLLFSGSSHMLSHQSLPATEANKQAALRMVQGASGAGGTELLPALRKALEQPRLDELSRTIVVITDGYVTVEQEAFALVRNKLGEANLFAFGIGSSVNRHLIEGLARAGMGEPFIVTRPDEAQDAATRLRKLIDSPVLTSVQAHFEGLDVYDVEPAHLPDVFAQRPVLVFGKWRAAPGAEDGRARARITGESAAGPYRELVTADAAAAPQAQGTPTLGFLWARHRIARLSDQEGLVGGQTQKPSITELGLKYSLLTQYTSFVAVDRLVRNAGGFNATAHQPSPLPQGVTDLAVGGDILGADVSSTPEPATWAAMLVVLAVLAERFARRRRRTHWTA